jgi:hypothetical protein
MGAMTMTTPIRAIYDEQEGTLKLLDPVKPQVGQTISIQIVEQDKPEDDKPRIAGLHEGNWWISDDFDDELPDSFWLGEDEISNKING